MVDRPLPQIKFRVLSSLNKKVINMHDGLTLLPWKPTGYKPPGNRSETILFFGAVCFDVDKNMVYLSSYV